MDHPAHEPDGLTDEELEAQGGAPLPEREAMSAIKAGGLGSGIDNFAMPINEAIAINYDSVSSIAVAGADQIVILDQTDIDGGGVTVTTPNPDLTPEEMDGQQAAALPDREAMSLLDLNADLDLALDVAAPVDAAVAANANVAAPIDAAVSANVLSFNSDALAEAPQDSIIVQNLDGEATATTVQDATVDQSDPAAGA